MALAERAGLDSSLVAAALATGQAGSPQVVRSTSRIAKNDHGPTAFTPRLRLKDIDFALRLGQKLGLDSEFGRVAEAAFRRLWSSATPTATRATSSKCFAGRNRSRQP